MLEDKSSELLPEYMEVAEMENTQVFPAHTITHSTEIDPRHPAELLCTVFHS
jgi:hypothetical protein